MLGSCSSSLDWDNSHVQYTLQKCNRITILKKHTKDEKRDSTFMNDSIHFISCYTNGNGFGGFIEHLAAQLARYSHPLYFFVVEHLDGCVTTKAFLWQGATFWVISIVWPPNSGRHSTNRCLWPWSQFTSEIVIWPRIVTWFWPSRSSGPFYWKKIKFNKGKHKFLLPFDLCMGQMLTLANNK